MLPSILSNVFRDRHQSYTNLPLNEYDQSMKEFSKITDYTDSQTVSIFIAKEDFSSIPQ